MTDKVKKLEGWIGFFFVVTMVLLFRVVYLQDALEEERQDFIKIEMEYQRLERRSQFYLEQWNEKTDKLVLYRDQLDQLSANRDAVYYTEQAEEN